MVEAPDDRPTAAGALPDMSVSVWRGNGSGGTFETFEVPREESQTVLDVVFWILVGWIVCRLLAPASDHVPWSGALRSIQVISRSHASSSSCTLW